MFRLTREVRFALPSPEDSQWRDRPANGYAGFPAARGLAPFLLFRVTLEGALDSQSGYLRNIKEIDQFVRNKIIPVIAAEKSLRIDKLFTATRNGFAGEAVHSVALWLTPFCSLTQLASEFGMFTRLSQKFEFSASHRLHNPKLSPDENMRLYGKCNNPNGHGHNYEVQVTLRGKPNDSGLLIEMPAFEKLVHESAIAKLDHKNLNLDVPEFRELIPTVENIAMAIYRMLKNRFTGPGMGVSAELASVTVWETPKTWCEYAE